MSDTPWPQRWWIMEAEANIDLALRGWYDPKECGLRAIRWLEKALRR